MAKKLANMEARFGEYLARLAEVIGHADRREPLRAYMAGLLLPGERKSVEPMAASDGAWRTAARHQSLLISSATRLGARRKVFRVREIVLLGD